MIVPEPIVKIEVSLLAGWETKVATAIPVTASPKRIVIIAKIINSVVIC